MRVIIDGVEYAPISPILASDHNLSSLLRATRKAIGYTLDDAAKHIGCSKSYLWGLENNNCEPSLRVASKISRTYGISLLSMAAALKTIVDEV